MQLIERLKKLPAWAWAVIGMAVAAVVVVFLRRSGGGVSIAPPAYGPGMEPAPAAGSGPSFEAFAGALGQLAEQQAETNEAITQIGQQTAAAISAVMAISNSRAMTVVTSSGYVPAAPRLTPITTPADAVATTPTVTASTMATAPVTAPATAPLVGAVPQIVERTVQTWVDDDQVAGYVSRVVKVDTTDPAAQFVTGILGAKDRYTAAEKAGDRAGMNAAHADAERLRKLAEAEGVTLPAYTRSGR